MGDEIDLRVLLHLREAERPGSDRLLGRSHLGRGRLRGHDEGAGIGQVAEEVGPWLVERDAEGPIVRGDHPGNRRRLPGGDVRRPRDRTEIVGGHGRGKTLREVPLPGPLEVGGPDRGPVLELGRAQMEHVGSTAVRHLPPLRELGRENVLLVVGDESLEDVVEHVGGVDVLDLARIERGDLRLPGGRSAPRRGSGAS